MNDDIVKDVNEMIDIIKRSKHEGPYAVSLDGGKTFFDSQGKALSDEDIESIKQVMGRGIFDHE